MGNTLQFIGDHQPISTMFNGQMISGYDTNAYSGQEISVSDTYNDNLDLTVFGRSEQKQTVQGKNLLPYPLDLSTYVIDNFVDRVEISQESDEVKVSALLNESVDTAFSFISPSFYLPQNTTVTVSFYAFIHDSDFTFFDLQKKEGSASLLLSEAGVRIQASDNILPVTQDDWVQYHFTVTTNEESKFKVRLGSDMPNLYGIGNYVKYKNIQVELGSTATPYEPFVPNSPSPDYPSPIESAFDDGGQLIVTGSRPQQSATPPVLRAIPVTPDYPDPTYVDASGQAWVADEWRSDGAVVRRIRHIDIDGINYGVYKQGVLTNDIGENLVWFMVANIPVDTYKSIAYVSTIYSNFFKPYWRGSSVLGTREGVCPNSIGAGRAYPIFAFKEENSPSDITQWLRENNVYMDFVLETPTTETLPSTPIRTNPHTTSIHTTTTVKPWLSAQIKTIRR